MTEKLHTMRIERVPHSSVVGSSLKIVADGVGVVALLIISVPQPHLDYKTVADAVATAILNGHVSGKGVTLVLPANFKEAAIQVLDACNHDFQGWRDFPDGSGGEQICTKCGMAPRAVITDRDPKTLAFREKSCERKRWFRSRTAAEIVGSRFGHRAYHCRFCDGYHLTAQELTLAETQNA